MRTDAFRWRRRVLSAKLGGGLDCLTWGELLTLLPRSSETWPFEKFAVPVETANELVKYRTPLGDFWGPADDRGALGATIIETLGGVYEWSSVRPRPGDVVFDLGTYLGTFTRVALQRGAARVICFEANAINARCLRVTFAREIQDGVVTLVESPVWSESRPVRFSGKSMTGQVGEDGAEMQAVTIDEIVRRLGLQTVDFMKADIEGAERHALTGAADTLARFHPRLAFCIYHYPDDPKVIPAIAKARHDYRVQFDESGRYVYCW